SKMKTLYKGHAMQFMHAFWGVGQMSFVKHAIFVDENAPDLNSYEEITKYILDRVDKKKIFISKGIVDHLDHSSNEQFVGGKLGVDATDEKVERKIDILSDEDLLEKAKALDNQIMDLKQFALESSNPICVVSVNKQDSIKKLFGKLESLSKHIAILVVIDHKNNDLKYPYMLVWRVVNNIDADRDILLDPFIAIDATNKSEIDGFHREWPGDTLCTKEVLESLKERGLVEYDDELIKKFGLLEFN
ncbi:MAG: UbiD family decarboxylase, partial [Epsilonproteobacteria bacterium]|nr:UbiD family decarboxylase [Campylobacterota bacterium]